MKYAIIKVINGNFFIDSEGYASPEAAKPNYHGVCQALWAEPSVVSACVKIVDENLDMVLGCKEVISHSAV